MTAKPLAGLRVLTFEQYGAGPYCTMFLGGMGADVIKIENPHTGGDFARNTGPYFLGENDSLYFQCLNFNKRSLALDLKTAKGREIFEALVGRSDVVVNNLRGNQPAKLHLDYQSLRSIKPAIVCAHISAYGRDNSRADRPGYDFLMQGECGFMTLTGEPDGPPARFGLSMVDYMTGMMMAFSITATVQGIKSGTLAHGCDIDLSLMDAALHQLTYQGMWYLNAGLLTGRNPRSAHPSVTPSQMLRCRDGWVFIMCQNDKFWDALVEAIERPELRADPRFADISSRLANREALTRILDEVFTTRTAAEWITILSGKVPIGPVYDLAQALDNPFLAETGMVQSVPHPDQQGMRGLANPVRIDGERPSLRRGPKLGEHSAAILAELGYADADIT